MAFFTKGDLQIAHLCRAREPRKDLTCRATGPHWLFFIQPPFPPPIASNSPHPSHSLISRAGTTQRRALCYLLLRTPFSPLESTRYANSIRLTGGTHRAIFHVHKCARELQVQQRTQTCIVYRHPSYLSVLLTFILQLNIEWLYYFFVFREIKSMTYENDSCYIFANNESV